VRNWTQQNYQGPSTAQTAKLRTPMSRLWPNRLLPGILAVVIARLTYVWFAQGPTSVLIVFGFVFGLLPTLYVVAVHAVGFAYGLLDREASASTSWFAAGWNAGRLRSWRTNS